MDIDELTDEQVIQRYHDDLTELFTITDNHNIEAVLETAYGYGADDFSSDYALLQYDEYASQAVQMRSYSRDHPEFAEAAVTLMRKIQSSYNILMDLLNFNGGSHAFTMSAEEYILRFTANDDETKLKAIQIVFKFILQWCKRLNLRHDGKNVYSEKVNDKGEKTSAWVVARNVGGEDLSDFPLLISYICQKKHNAGVFDHWMTVSSESVATLLKTSMEVEFRRLRPCRHWLSFADGLYHTITDTFIPYNERRRFGIASDITTAIYHDIPFQNVYRPVENGPILDPLLEIQTPTLDQIFETQHFSAFTQFLIMAYLGRMLFWTNTFDSWQVAVYFKGLAGTFVYYSQCIRHPCKLFDV
jgi:hypothetical protein